MLHGDVLGERARLTPDKLALVDVTTGRRLSYGELDARVSASAHVLAESLTLTKGDRLALLAGNSVEFIELFLAAGRTGVVLVPINTHLTEHEIEFILGDADPRAVIADDNLAERCRHGAGSLPLVGMPRYSSLRETFAERPFQRVSCTGDDLYCLL